MNINGQVLAITKRAEHILHNATDKDRSLAKKLGRRAVAIAQQKINKGVKPANAALTRATKQGGKTLRDRGQLMASLSSKSVAPGSAVYGSRLPYARTVHDGATIRPRKARMLWVPASSDTRKFERKYGSKPAQVIAGLRSDGYKLWRQGRAFFAASADKKIKLYILLNKVTIPARRFLVLSDSDRKALTSMIKEHIYALG